MKKLMLLSIFFALALAKNSVHAQTYSYFFNGDLTEANGGPALGNITSCGAATGTFPSEIVSTVLGNCSGLPQNVFAFDEGGGLLFPNSNFIGGTYTINVFFKFNSLSGYQRILDFLNGTTDVGLYTLNSCLNFYPNGDVGTCPFFVAGKYYLLTLVRDGATDVITIYVNGTSFGTYSDAAKTYVPSTTNGPIIFFRDNVLSSAQCEDRDGSIKYLSLSPITSTAGQVSSTWTGICSIALPLNLLSFTAQKNNTAVALSWKTASENNVSHFEIERSGDGIAFEVLDKIQATNRNTNTIYTYKDEHPAIGTSFYRIKMIDRDGNFKYSATIKINFSGSGTLQLYPNPATDVMVISGINRTGVVKMISTDGKIVLQKNAAGESISINISSIPRGIYIVEYSDGGLVQRQKLIKN